MTCEQRSDQILLYAADALEPGEQREIRAHLDTGCPICAAVLAEARSTMEHLPFAVDPVSPPPAVRARLMERVRIDELGAAAPVVARSTPVSISSSPFAQWIRAAVAAAIAGVLVYLAASIPLKKQVADLSRRLGSLQTELAGLQFEQERSVESLQVLQSPSVQLVNLKGTPAEPNAAGRIFWDRSRNVWHVYAAGLKPLPPSKTYELWFIPTGKPPVRAETFDVDANGNGSVTVTVPKALGPIAVAAVTEEPAGGTDAPSAVPGVLLAGNISVP